MPGAIQSPSMPGGAYGGVPGTSYQLPTATGGIYSAGGGQPSSTSGGSMDIGDYLLKYGPLALGVLSAISGAKQSGQASQYLDSAILAQQGDYNARAPIRKAGIAALSGLPDPAEIERRLAAPSNPFYTPGHAPPSALPPSYRLDAPPTPLPQVQPTLLSVGPNGLPLPRRNP